MSARKEINECACGCECVLLAALVVVACPVRGGVRGVCCGVIGAGVCGRVWACVGVLGRGGAWGRVACVVAGACGGEWVCGCAAPSRRGLRPALKERL